jgi:hypothetical protein
MARNQRIVTSLSFVTRVLVEMHNIYSCNSELHDARKTVGRANVRALL